MKSPPSTLRLLCAASLVLALALATWLAWPPGNPSSPSTTTAPATTSAYAIDLTDPEPSHEVLRYVVDTGGDKRTREVALVWLDEQARLGQPLHPAQETALLAMLRKNGHPSWDGEYRLWIFNSAFNVLQLTGDPEPLTHLLQNLALHDPHRTMRLYALQHIGLMRSSTRLTGAPAAEIHTTLEQLATAPESEVAGTAIALLAAWQGPQAPADPEVLAQAAHIAADADRAVDVRITALHAADAQALPTARQLAGDAAQHVLLRKAAIACIGRHGNEADFPVLEKLTQENSRLAQATDPALRAIRHRLTNPQTPALVPF